MLTGRNRHLNSAFLPAGPDVDIPDTVGTGAGDTNFDPFLGTGWGEMLDALGAKNPGGIKGMRGMGLPPSLTALDSQNPNDPSTVALKKARAAYATAGGTL